MVLYPEYPMDKGHNLMVNPSQCVHVMKHENHDACRISTQAKKLLFTAVMTIFLGRNGGGVGRMLLPSKGK